MSPLKFLPPAILAVLLAAVLPSQAQQPNTEFKITKIEPALIESPTFNGIRYKDRVKAKTWLEVEVTFEWEPKGAKAPKYTDELTANFYILLNTLTAEFPKGPLLVGSVAMTSVGAGKDLRTVAYVSPRTLEKLFDGKNLPGTADQVVLDIGVTLSKQGQMVAVAGWKTKTGDWWSSRQQTPGFVLNKNETPFAPLAWDYFEAIKPKGPGL